MKKSRDSVTLSIAIAFVSIGLAGCGTSSSIVIAPALQGTDVTTFKNDLARTGQNLTETTLTTTNVSSSTFGLLRNIVVTGKVDAQPLYLSQFVIKGAAHNIRSLQRSSRKRRTKACVWSCTRCVRYASRLMPIALRKSA